MRAKSELHRALVRTSLGLHLDMQQRRDNVHFDQAAEREQQFQHEFAGTIGSLPGGTETTFDLHFDIVFDGDSGVSRDSQLGEPIARFGFRMDQAPQGAVPYAYVYDWIVDDDLNYRGARVVAGVLPTSPTPGPFKGVVHSTFQGFGAPVEEDNAVGGHPETGHTIPVQTGTPIDVGPTATPGPTGTATAPGGSSAPGSVGGPPTSLTGAGGGSETRSKLGLPAYASGPLGAAVGATFTAVSTWNANGALSDWTSPPKGIASPTDVGLRIADDGRLTVVDSDLASSVDQDWVRGDKVAGIWTAPAVVGGGYKVRAEFAYAPNRNHYPMMGLVMNMKDRHNGLAFFFGSRVNPGWTTNLRLLGMNLYDFYNFLRSIQGATHSASGLPEMRGQDVDALNGCNDFYRSDLWTSSNAIGQGQNAAARLFYPRSGHAWAEMWRTGDTVWAAVYFDNPDSGATPIYASFYTVKNHPRYGPGNAGHFGFTWDFGFTSDHSNAGIYAMTLYKQN